jgi:hypothetical protein
MFILVARAERKGGLDYAEGTRLREGLRYLAANHVGEHVQDATVVQMRRKYDTARKRAWRWKGRATGGTVAVSGGVVHAAVDEDARDALRRVAELAARWTHIPAKRQAGASVLAAISNQDLD